jgi:hypothetical protein
MKELAKDEPNVVAANNVYHKHYIKFFTVTKLVWRSNQGSIL